MRTQPKKNYLLNIFTTWSIYCSLFFVVLTLAPFNIQFDNPETFTWTFRALDLVENIFILFPVGLLFMLAQHEQKLKNILKCTIFGLLLSASVETVQLYIESRSSQYWDIIANTFGIFCGALCALSIKPFMRKLSISSKTTAKILNSIICLIILTLVRIMTNQQSLSYFEYCLIATSAMVTAHFITQYNRKEREKNFYNRILLAFIVSFISLFPLFISSPSLFYKLTIIHVLLTSIFCFMLIRKGKITNKTKRLIIQILVTVAVTTLLTISIYSLITTESGVVMFVSDTIKTSDNGRKYGGVVMGFIVLITLTLNQINIMLKSFNINSKIKIDTI